MSRINRKELIELINSVKCDKSEFWILSSGALTVRGIYPDAGDLDIAVTDEGLKQLAKNYDLEQKENGWYIVNDLIECVCDGKKETLEYQPELIGDIQVQNIYEYLKYLKSSERKKDIDRIPLVEKYIRELEEN